MTAKPKPADSLLLVLKNERPVSLNAYYAGMHWTARKREADRVHALVRAACCQWRATHKRHLPQFQQARIIVTAYFDKRPHDASNIAVKLYEDGLVRAGVLPGDSPRYVTEVVARSRIDRERPRLEILVE